jgi:tRNA dimethylallyltransferase
MERQELYRRIEVRVEAMVEEGLVLEVGNLLEGGCHPALTSMQGLGYKEIVAHLAGNLSLSAAMELLKRNTRRFAKRQLTWFRRDAQIKWHAVDTDSDRRNVTKEIIKKVAGKY